MNKDSSGSEIDNVKHFTVQHSCLYVHTPDNAALQLLFTYCVTFFRSWNQRDTLRTDAIKNFHGRFKGRVTFKEGRNGCVGYS